MGNKASNQNKKNIKNDTEISKLEFSEIKEKSRTQSIINKFKLISGFVKKEPKEITMSQGYTITPEQQDRHIETAVKLLNRNHGKNTGLLKSDKIIILNKFTNNQYMHLYIDSSVITVSQLDILIRNIILDIDIGSFNIIEELSFNDEKLLQLNYEVGKQNTIENTMTKEYQLPLTTKL